MMEDFAVTVTGPDLGGPELHITEYRLIDNGWFVNVTVEGEKEK